MDELPQGCVLSDKYRVLSTIGRGAYGRVYLARDLHGVGQYIAIKEITTHQLPPEDAEAIAHSFSQEARILASLDHDGLPRIYDYFEVGTAYYLVMEWIAGQTLLTMMEERGSPFSVTEVLGWGAEVCRILSYLHTQQPPVIVGDVKPGNIMRTFDGQLKIVDFGVARYAAHHGARHEGQYTFVTPGFSPPEQYDSLHIDSRSDIYALAATMYYLMTGQPLDRFRFQVPPLRRFVPSATAMTEELLAKCLQANRTARPSDAATLRRRLQGAMEAETPRETGRSSSEAKDILSSLYQGKRKIRSTLDDT